MKKLRNPEMSWVPEASLQAPELVEIERRIGAVHEPVELLGGGLANLNLKIGRERVLRIYRRDPSAMPKERALLMRPWQFLTVPRVLASGHDYLLLSYVEHEALKGGAEEGEALGCALSEIHASSYASPGYIGADLELSQPWPDLLSSLSAFMAGCFAKLDAGAYGALGDAACRLFEKSAPELRDCAGPAQLLHADFKLSNLHRCASGPPLVLDWEFAYAGSALSDIGQLMRWNPPHDFVDGFEAAYQASEAGLPKGWRRLAALMDLPNLAGLLLNTRPGSIRDRDISVLIKEILQS